MPQVKANQFINSTRSIMVPLTFEDDTGARLTEPFKVIYRSFSPKVAREMQALEADDTNASTAKSLAAIVVSIPDITNGDGGPLAITEEHLEAMDRANLLAIYKAISKDVNPTQADTDQESSAASPGTLPPAAPKA